MSVLGYKIDGNDLWSTYRVQVCKSRGLYHFLERKTPFEHSWFDSHGVEGFTKSTDIEFKARTFILQCYLRGTSRDNFFTNLKNFKELIYGSGTHTLQVPYESTTFTVFYIKGSPLSFITPFQTSDAGSVTKDIVAQFTVRFREPNPANAAEPALP